jgi:hypothetical protein
LFKVIDAYGIDAKTLEVLPEDAFILIRDVESGKTYSCKKSDYTLKGEYYHFKGKEDYRVQKFLARKFFEIVEPPKKETRNWLLE